MWPGGGKASDACTAVPGTQYLGRDIIAQNARRREYRGRSPAGQYCSSTIQQRGMREEDEDEDEDEDVGDRPPRPTQQTSSQNNNISILPICVHVRMQLYCAHEATVPSM
jgi:hypothetical protein